MKKFTTIASLAFSLFFLSACESLDSPSPLDTRASASSSDINPDNLPGDADMNAGLQDRGMNGLGGAFDPDHINPEDIVCTVYFGFDQYAVAADERGKVKQAAEYYNANPEYKVVLVGHTDWYGTEEYNMLLSDKRCKAIQDYMGSLGVGSDRSEVVARGEAGAAVDVAKNSPEAKKDRRVDVVKVRQ